MSVQTARDLTDGALLDGKYRIRRILGQGGMGMVVEALHVELEDRVAIKFLTPRALGEPEAIQRFIREAKAAVRLRSEHIARVRDVGALAGGEPYIVMEYLDGVELRQLLSGPRLAPGALVDLILQACEGLAEAHSLGIVHRDIKPSNLFVTGHADGMPHLKVLDFGVSKVPLDDLHLTGTNSWMGTPAYMSPEQMRSTRAVDPRSDLWSLAVVLYEGLEGRVPFPGDSLTDLCIAVTTTPPAPLTERTPPELGAVVLRGLEKDPERRYANAAAFAEALAPFAETASQAELVLRRARRLLDRKVVTPANGVAMSPSSAVLRVVMSGPTEALPAAPARAAAAPAPTTKTAAPEPAPTLATALARAPVAAPPAAAVAEAAPIAAEAVPIAVPLDAPAVTAVAAPPRWGRRLALAAMALGAVALGFVSVRLWSADAPAAAIVRSADAALPAPSADAAVAPPADAAPATSAGPVDAPAPADAAPAPPDAPRSPHRRGARGEPLPPPADAAPASVAPPTPADAAPRPPDADPLGRRT